MKDSRGYNPNKNSNKSTPLSFNPITNQPLSNYMPQEQINKMKREQELNQNQLKELYKDMDKDRYQQLKGNQNEQNPVEYNPYKRPYSIYQGHP